MDFYNFGGWMNEKEKITHELRMVNDLPSVLVSDLSEALGESFILAIHSANEPTADVLKKMQELRERFNSTLAELSSAQNLFFDAAYESVQNGSFTAAEKNKSSSVVKPK
jgi:hypothetical protein